MHCSLTEDFADKICVLITVFILSLSLDYTNINIAGLCWITGSPWKCPQIHSCPFPEHTACNHEAHRRATGLLAAADTGTPHRNMFTYIESHVVYFDSQQYNTTKTLSLFLVHLFCCPSCTHLFSDGPSEA